MPPDELADTETGVYVGVMPGRYGADYADTHASPNVRRFAKGSGVGTGAVYKLFPGTPGKKVAMIAGVPKPVGCV